MKHTQEYIAEQLFEQLIHFYSTQNPDVQLRKEGAGVHWDCTISFRGRACTIHCFEHRNYEDVRPEYLVDFIETGAEKACGRTFEVQEVLSSSVDWINEKSVETLYEQYTFVDQVKRSMQRIEVQLLTHEPTLQQIAQRELTHYGSDWYDYRMAHHTRGCRLVGLGNTTPVSFAFHWDDCQLFVLEQNDLSLMAEVLKKWLVESIPPSALERQYDWIKVGELAHYYEKGEGIKGEFIQSWEDITRFYSRFSPQDHAFQPDALQLIQDMKDEGLNSELRAGQSLFSFILSRARRHGLSRDQASLHITFLEDNRMRVVPQLGIKQAPIEVEIAYAGAFREWVQLLLEEEIN